MSDQKVYKVRVNGAEYGADDKASAKALAELLEGEVFSVSRKDALSHVRTITATPDYPPALANMVAEVKTVITSQIAGAGLMDGSCFRVIAQYDSKGKGWYFEVKNLANGPTVYNQTTGEKYPSVVHARWEHGRTCAVKYLSNGISGDDKFSKTVPEAAKSNAEKLMS